MKLQLLHICSSFSVPLLLSLALLLLPPQGLSLPYQAAAYLPALEGPDWLQTWLRGSPGVSGTPGAEGSRLWSLMGDPETEELLELLAKLQKLENQLGWASAPEGQVQRAQREEVGPGSLGTFPKHPIEGVAYHHQVVRDESEGSEKRNEALMSIAGDLQAFNRQKGGFGFRFGRK
ncbi:uncharacterized protein qrfp [Hoplias malabaricus]|uniref:uncharacterized protein qrfp n=1 Tax=Hoplias malabaricus TaxID=27720 RepID=UPI003462A45A